MDQLKRTVLFDAHVKAGATMVDFGGWEMPIQYPSGIVAEHLFTRSECSLFDVSHMGRLIIDGKDQVKFLQHVLSSDVEALEYLKAGYCIIPDEEGGAVDDAYLYRFDEDKYFLVVNASNKEKDLAHFANIVKDYDCTITDISDDWASIAVQGPKSEKLMQILSDGPVLSEVPKNGLLSLTLEGHDAKIARTGYTGEPLGYEVFVKTEDAEWFWNRLLEMGAKPAGLGARDTLRTEASMPLYGHEFGVDADGKKMPVYAVSLANFAVSFAERKGDFIGKAALAEQKAAYERLKNKDYSDYAALSRRIRSLVLLDRGVLRNGMPIYQGDKQVGWVTSGTMIPYFEFEGKEAEAHPTEKTGKRSIGLCYIDSDVKLNSPIEVDVRGKRLKATTTLKHINAADCDYAVPKIFKQK